MHNIQIVIHDTRARALLTGITTAATSPGVRQVIGRAATNLIQKHLRELDSQRPNKLGGKRGHFYSKAAASTHYRHAADGVQVAITHTGFALRYYGGVVRPRPGKKALAIPVRATHYGIWPKELNDPTLFVHWPKGKRVGILAKRVGSSLRALYFLVSKATIHADKSLLPKQSALQTAVAANVAAYMQRTAARNQPDGGR
jgi:hypothetical protein